MPPASRNDRAPNADDMPTSAAASSLVDPRVIAFQNPIRCSRRAVDGRPGDQIFPRISRTACWRSCLYMVSNHLRVEVLRRPLESAQLTSWAFTRRALDSGLLPSMGSIGDCYDNAVIESFWGRMQVELLDRKRWPTRVELASAIFEYLEIFHNRQRRHSALGMLTPFEFEAVYQPTTAA